MADNANTTLVWRNNPYTRAVSVMSSDIKSSARPLLRVLEDLMDKASREGDHVMVNRARALQGALEMAITVAMDVEYDVEDAQNADDQTMVNVWG